MPSVNQERKKGIVALTSSSVSLRLLEVFVLVVQEGTLSAAAERLNLSQAAVSQAITALEQALGAKILDRSVRPPALTLAGGTVLNFAAEITEKMRELESVMRHNGGRQLALLRIGMLNSFAATVGAFVLNQMRDIADAWTVESGFKATRMRALLDRESDVIITSDTTPVPPQIEASLIFTEPFVLALPASYRGKTSDIHRLADKLDFIRYGHETHLSGTLNGYFAKIGASPGKRYQFDTTDAALNMVAGGFGWTIVSPLILLKSATLISSIGVVLLKDAPIHRKIIIAMRRGEGFSIARKIRAAALLTTREILLPKLKALVPQAARHIVVASDRW